MSTQGESSIEDSEGDILEDEFYTFLNVPKEASSEEINNAYRRLSRLYHPDKHPDPVQKKQAETMFNKTKKAYEVLSDPHKRAIYDSLGMKGLETDGWEIVQRTKTPREIREEYEHLAREREERLLHQRTNPKGNITVHVNATDLFESYDEDDDDRIIPNIEISGMSITQSVDAPLTLKDTLSLSGQLATHNGTGSGAISCSLRRVLNEKTWMELETSAGNGLMFTLRGFRSISTHWFVNMAGICQMLPRGARIGFQSVVARQLDKRTTGYLTWKVGNQSCMNTMVVWDAAPHYLALSVQLGVPNTFALLSYTRKFEDDARIKGLVKLGTLATYIEYGCEKRVSKHSILGASMSIGIPNGVTLKIKVNRSSQNYIFPIMLSEELLPTSIIYGSVAPLVIYYVVKVLVVNPYLHKQKLREMERQKDANARKVAEKRREAETAVSLMTETVARIRETEEKKNGLIIVQALFGKLYVEGKRVDNSGDEVVDVTIPIQCLVKESKLVLHESSKANLPGFYDPCVGEDKHLYIQYSFHTLLHEVIITDTEQLRIPKQCHRAES